MNLVHLRFQRWLAKHHTPGMVCQAEELTLRRDMVTLLQYVLENKAVGTQSTGNMPLKAVREVTAQFVNPPKLDSSIGDRVYRLRSEADVWPLHFLRILAEVGELVQIAPARRWQVTLEGKRFLSMDSLLQVSFLLTVWWYQVNWLIVYPYEGMGETLPRGFEQTALEYLLALPVGERIEFEECADEIIEATGLTWRVEIDNTHRLLQGSIKRMIVDQIASFGGVEREFREKPLGKGAISELVAFEITALGRVLLEGVAVLQ
jgi:hypothetical protein